MRLLFDLDGTLTNPFPGITQSIQHALTALGHPSPPIEDLRWCIGPPLRQSFARLLGPGQEHLVETAMVKYRERFGTVGLFENELYPGITAVLAEFQAAGHILSVATSKPTVYAERILRHFELSPFFRTVDGCEMDGTRADKALLLAHVMQRDAITPAEAVMIGDREHDMIAARANGMAGLGVLWGYGSEMELRAAGAYACAARPADLPPWLAKRPQIRRDTALRLE